MLLHQQKSNQSLSLSVLSLVSVKPYHSSSVSKNFNLLNFLGIIILSLVTNFHNYYTIWWELLKQHTRRIDIQHMITREVKTQNTCRPAFPPRHWWPRKPMEEGTNTYPGTHQQPPTATNPLIQ